MEYHDDWSSLLADHPIFSRGEDAQSQLDISELSSETVSAYTGTSTEDASPAFSGRRQTMIIKDTELVASVGREIRIMSLKEAELSKNMRRAFKTLRTPNVQFEVRQIALNPTEKLLAVAGEREISVIVLPRPGYMRLAPAIIDCKSIQIGQFYHGDRSASPIAKIQWHPWGEAGSTLLVMTVDGILREYDISVDTEDPTQTTSFGQDRRLSKSFQAQDPSEHEVASFTIGKGRADWGSLTIYAITRSGDIYAICPYLPQNAVVDASYLDALECFVSAKQDYISKHSTPETLSLSVAYDYQRKYINALLKQLPPGTAARTIKLHPPAALKHKPLRQGPFLLQPSPRSLDGSDKNDATDIAYLSFGGDSSRDEGVVTESLSVILVATQDGKVDICLDVMRIEPRWEAQKAYNELPILAVYESADLGLISLLSTEPPVLNLLAANHPVIFLDPIHEEIFYVYHAFGVHSINLAKVITNLGEALQQDDGSGASVLEALGQNAQAEVQPMVTTFSIQQRASNPVVAVAIPNDVYVTYSITVLTSAMRAISFPLNMRLSSILYQGSKASEVPNAGSSSTDRFLRLLPGPAPYASLLSEKPYGVPSVLSRPPGPSLTAASGSRQQELSITPDTLRYLGKVVEQFMKQIREIQGAYREAVMRNELQHQEHNRQAERLLDMQIQVAALKGERQRAMEVRVRHLRESQSQLLKRLDAVLQGSMKRANPDLSDQEKRWFDELKRMEVEVLGSGRHDPDSLRARASMLQREYDRLKPHFGVAKDKQQALVLASRETDWLGASQAFELGVHSHRERAKIERIQRDLMAIARSVNYPLGAPHLAQGSKPPM